MGVGADRGAALRSRVGAPVRLSAAPQVAEISYIDNQDCIDLIEVPRVGILNILDEECRMPKATDKTFAQKLHTQHAKHARFAAPKVHRSGKKSGLGASSNFTADEAFIVKHFAGDVTYCVDGFLDKNMDPLNEDVEKMMSQSVLPLLATLFPYVEQPAGGGRGRSKRKQVWAPRSCPPRALAPARTHPCICL